MHTFEINTIIIHYSEIGLKGKNQPQFRKKLKANIKKKLKSENLLWPVSEKRGYLTISISEKEETKVEQVLQLLAEIAGIAWFTPAQKILYNELKVSDKTFDSKMLEDIFSDLAKSHYSPQKTFCVRVKRTNKKFPMLSLDLERQLGAAIFERTDWNKVSLKQPDVTFQFNIQSDEVFIFCEKIPGIGGLPVGTVGKVLTLLSGGIDSPVAAYLAARRGCRVDFIHFTATRMQQSEAEEYKISGLAQYLSKYTLRSRLYLVPYIHFDMALFGQNVDYELVLFRRFMVCVAQKLAEQKHHEVLLTGDNLAQVASQTLPNIVSTSQAVNIPILRPLLTYDKQEIIDLAQKIGTFKTSIEPYKDCCAIISRNPKTTSKAEFLEKLEDKIFGDGYNKLIDDTLEDIVCLEFEYGKKCKVEK